MTIPTRTQFAIAVAIAMTAAGCGKSTKSSKGASEGAQAFAAMKDIAGKAKQAIAGLEGPGPAQCPTLAGTGDLPVIDVDTITELVTATALKRRTTRFTYVSKVFEIAVSYATTDDEKYRASLARDLASADAATAAAAPVIAVIQIDEEVAPKVGASAGTEIESGEQVQLKEKFAATPGKVSGRLTFVDVATAKPLCGKAFTVTNDMKVETTGNLEGALDQDLVQGVSRAVYSAIYELANQRKPLSRS